MHLPLTRILKSIHSSLCLSGSKGTVYQRHKMSGKRIIHQNSSPYKLPEKRIPRDIVTWHGDKIVEKFQKAFCLDIFRLILADPEQKRLCIKLQAGQFIDKCGVKHHICLFLIREDVCFLSSSYRRPSGDRVLCTRSARSRITHNPSDQSAIRGRDTVVFVDIQLCQRTDIDLEFTSFGRE